MPQFTVQVTLTQTRTITETREVSAFDDVTALQLATNEVYDDLDNGEISFEDAGATVSAEVIGVDDLAEVDDFEDSEEEDSELDEDDDDWDDEDDGWDDEDDQSEEVSPPAPVRTGWVEPQRDPSGRVVIPGTEWQSPFDNDPALALETPKTSQPIKNDWSVSLWDETETASTPAPAPVHKGCGGF